MAYVSLKDLRLDEREVIQLGHMIQQQKLNRYRNPLTQFEDPESIWYRGGEDHITEEASHNARISPTVPLGQAGVTSQPAPQYTSPSAPTRHLQQQRLSRLVQQVLHDPTSR